MTVAKKTGMFQRDGVSIEIVDLPGTYSLTAHSLDEQVTRDFLINEKPDVVIDVIDYSNLERNLFLTMQLKELGVPLILAFNMSDVAMSRSIKYDILNLSKSLGSPIIKTVGDKKHGIEQLIQEILKHSIIKHAADDFKINYGKYLEKQISSLSNKLSVNDDTLTPALSRWTAIKLLENDEDVLEKISSEDLKNEAQHFSEQFYSKHREDPEIQITEKRYSFISEICKFSTQTTSQSKITTSDKVDSVLTHRIFGLPIFLVMMYLVFNLTFTLGEPIMGWIESLFGLLANEISTSWSPGTDNMLKSLIVDGIINGVGGVLVFLPNIMLLFIAIAILEESGYMPRASFVMDKIMQKLGLQGKSFIPMLIGFGCTVPAIMATRTIETKRDRIVTMLILPLISCGARFPIYALIIPAFFPLKFQGAILYFVYLFGITLAIISAKLLRATLYKGATIPLILELPRYNIPTIKSVSHHMWEKSWMYLRKAGTIILAISIVMWFLSSYPKVSQSFALNENQVQTEQLSYSFAGRIGKVIEPVIKPLGFDWKIGTGMLGAFAAKEVFVAQLGIIFSVGEADENSLSLREKLKNNYTPLIGFCVIIFMLISAPCMATITITKQESGSWKIAMMQLFGLTIMAYLITFAIFQVGSLLGF